MTNSTNAPLYYRSLSRGLWKALECVGVTEELRDLRKDSAIRKEILGYLGAYFEDESTFSFYIFGSSFEGTTTDGLESDIDLLYCQEAIEVVEDTDELPTGTFASLLMVRDSTTKPGYFKLQYVENGTPQTAKPGQKMYLDNFMVDDNNRIVVCRLHYDPKAFDEHHGPADTVKATEVYKAGDLVQAFKCKRLPEVAEKWLRRIQNNSWTSSFPIENMKTLGAFFVPVGHPHSQQQEKEWRISLISSTLFLVADCLDVLVSKSDLSYT